MTKRQRDGKASNVWQMTEVEYGLALERARADRDDKADYWQLVRFYRGEIFHRDQAARALLFIRTGRSQ